MINSIKFKSTKKQFVKQLIYYFCRYFSEQNIKNYKPMVGFSFDSIHHHINIFGTYEMIELNMIHKFLKENIKKPQIALDIGANIGNHTIRLFADNFLEVNCFEPHEKVFDLLEINTRDLENVKIFKHGLSEEAKEVDFEICNTNLGGSRITLESKEIIDNNKKNFTKISVKKLDTIYEKFNRKIDLIKLDVEGHELQVLKGGKRIIQEHMPIILFEENNISQNGSSEVIEYLKDLNYKFFIWKENFYFGEGKFLKLLKFFLQDIFGAKIELVEVKRFQKKFYHLIFAKKISSNLD